MSISYECVKSSCEFSTTNQKLAQEHIQDPDLSHIPVVIGDSAEDYRQESQLNLAVGDTYLPDYDDVDRQRVTRITQCPWNPEAWDYKVGPVDGEEATKLCTDDMWVTKIRQIQIPDKHYYPTQFRR